MNLSLFVCFSLGAALVCGSAQAQQKTVPKPDTAKLTPVEQQIREAEAVGDVWMKHVAAGTIREGILQTWGYSAFDQQEPEQGARLLEAQLQKAGHLRMAWLQHDRCQVEDAAALGNDPLSVGRFIVLRYISQYENRTLRERLTLYEPLRNPLGLKIVGLDRADLPDGDLAAWDLGIALGEAVVLRWTTASDARWKPYLIEAGALAERLKIPLPPLPDAKGTPEEQRKAVLEYLGTTARVALQGLPERQGRLASAALTTSRLLVAYQNGTAEDKAEADTFAQRMSAAELPDSLWHAANTAVRRPAATAEVWNEVHEAAVAVSAHLSGAAIPVAAPSDAAAVVIEALTNMQKLGSFRVRAVLTTPEKKQAVMEGTMGRGTADLTVKAFDGSSWRRVAVGDSSWISRAGAAWEKDVDLTAVQNLTRTITLPLAPDSPLLTQYQLVSAEETVDGEKLTRVYRTDEKNQPPLEFWIARDTARGNVVRRLHLVLSFGDMQTDAVITLTQHGAVPEIRPPAK